MDGHDYVYRMKPLILPGLGYFVIYPLLIGISIYFITLPEIFLRIFSGIYAVSSLIILIIWIIAKSKRVSIDHDIIVFRSLFGKQVIEPKDIRKASFFWTKGNEEIVQIRVGKKTYYLSSLYFPFSELLTDLEEYITKHHIRSNLSSHYRTN